MVDGLAPAPQSALIHRKQELSSAVSVDADDLTRLSQHLGAFGVVSWSAELSDGTVREQLELGQLLALPNGSSAALIKVEAVATQGTSPLDFSRLVFRGHSKAVVTIRMRDFGAPCGVEASGEEKVVDAFWKQFLDWARDVKPSYSWMAMVPDSLGYSMSGGVLCSCLSYVLGTRFISPSTAWPIAVGLGLLTMIGGERLIKKVCPKVEFAVGHGKRRRDERQTLRTLVGIGFLLSVLGSVAASVIYERL